VPFSSYFCYQQDFTEENVLESLKKLNKILADNRSTQSQEPPRELGKTWTVQKPPKEEKKKRIPKELFLPITTDGPAGEASIEQVTVQGVGGSHYELRPTTPLTVSELEPKFSLLRQESCEGVRSEGVRGEGVTDVCEIDLLNESAIESRKMLATAEEKFVLYIQSFYY